ncbi:MAG TPA: DUF1150 family protein [Acetobacteraceae bacterium]|jgi:hypothetical protein
MHSQSAGTLQPRANRNSREIETMLSGVSSLQFQLLGLAEMTYAKPVHIETGIAAYSIHAADGTPLAMVDDLATALALVGEHNMILLRVH